MRWRIFYNFNKKKLHSPRKHSNNDSSCEKKCTCHNTQAAENTTSVELKPSKNKPENCFTIFVFIFISLFLPLCVSFCCFDDFKSNCHSCRCCLVNCSPFETAHIVMYMSGSLYVYGLFFCSIVFAIIINIIGAVVVVIFFLLCKFGCCCCCCCHVVVMWTYLSYFHQWLINDTVSDDISSTEQPADNANSDMYKWCYINHDQLWLHKIIVRYRIICQSPLFVAFDASTLVI